MDAQTRVQTRDKGVTPSTLFGPTYDRNILATIMVLTVTLPPKYVSLILRFKKKKNTGFNLLWDSQPLLVGKITPLKNMGF